MDKTGPIGKQTEQKIKKLLAEVFGEDNVVEKLAEKLLHDPDFDVLDIMIPAIAAWLRENWDEVKDWPIIKKYDK